VSKLFHVNRWLWPGWGSRNEIKGSYPGIYEGCAIKPRSIGGRETNGSPCAFALCTFAGFCCVCPQQTRRVVEALSWRRGPSHHQPPTDLIVFHDPCKRQLEATRRTCSKRPGVDRQPSEPGAETFGGQGPCFGCKTNHKVRSLTRRTSTGGARFMTVRHRAGRESGPGEHCRLRNCRLGGARGVGDGEVR